jgi:hypothetical protein
MISKFKNIVSKNLITFTVIEQIERLLYLKVVIGLNLGP